MLLTPQILFPATLAVLSLSSTFANSNPTRGTFDIQYDGFQQTVDRLTYPDERKDVVVPNVFIHYQNECTTAQREVIYGALQDARDLASSLYWALLLDCSARDNAAQGGAAFVDCANPVLQAYITGKRETFPDRKAVPESRYPGELLGPVEEGFDDDDV